MDEKELLKEFEDLKKSMEDIPKMKEIQDTMNKMLAKALEEINGYLIDEMQKAKSNMAKETIEEMIKNNFKLIVEIKEKKEK